MLSTLFFLAATLFPAETTQSIIQVLLVGGAVMVAIEGLKNMPGFIGEFIAAHPKVAVLANAVGSLLAAFGACLIMEDTIISVTCVIGAVSVFISAAGWHYVRKALTRAGDEPNKALRTN